MKKQVFVVHGGEVFSTYEEYFEYLKRYKLNFDYDLARTKSWKSGLAEELGENFEVVAPRMPSPMNAKYSEWELWFEKFLPYMKDDMILLGHSLGAVFLAKYLSGNDFPKKINSVHLVSAPFEEKDLNEQMGDFKLPKSLNKFSDQVEKIFLYHSKDDKIIPFIELEKYAKVLPKAEKVIFEDRNHFEQEEFPEIVEKIKKVSKIKSNER